MFYFQPSYFLKCSITALFIHNSDLGCGERWVYVVDMFDKVAQDAGRWLQTEFYFLLGKLELALGGILLVLTSDHSSI